MPREKKESKPFNIRMERSIYEKLVKFCELSGQSKTLAVERAVLLYIDRAGLQNAKEKGSGRDCP